MRLGKLPFGRPVKICSTRSDRVSATKVAPSVYGNRSLKLTVRVRQKSTLSIRLNNPRHCPKEIKNASTADKTQAVASADISNVPILVSLFSKYSFVNSECLSSIQRTRCADNAKLSIGCAYCCLSWIY